MPPSYQKFKNDQIDEVVETCNHQSMPLQTLCIVHTDASILLGLKKRGLGAGRWNGFGGTVHDGENVKTAAIREVHEETLITVEDLVEVGMLEFDLEDRGLHLEVYVFSARTFTGAPTETDEMRPLWFSLDQIPYSEMWPD